MWCCAQLFVQRALFPHMTPTPTMQCDERGSAFAHSLGCHLCGRAVLPAERASLPASPPFEAQQARNQPIDHAPPRDRVLWLGPVESFSSPLPGASFPDSYPTCSPEHHAAQLLSDAGTAVFQPATCLMRDPTSRIARHRGPSGWMKAPCRRPDVAPGMRCDAIMDRRQPTDRPTLRSFLQPDCTSPGKLDCSQTPSSRVMVTRPLSSSLPANHLYDESQIFAFENPSLSK